MVGQIITLCGLPGAGKGTTRRILEVAILEENCLVVSTSDIIRRELEKQRVTNFNDRRAKQEAFMRIAATEGKEWLVKRVVKALWRSERQIGIWDCVCMPEEVEWLKTLPPKKWIPFYIQAPFRIRLERRKAAARSGKPDAKPDEADMTAEQFREIHRHETAIHIPRFRNIPRNHIIRHDSGIENLGRQIIAVLFNEGIFTKESYREHIYLSAARRLLRFYEEFNDKVAQR